MKSVNGNPYEDFTFGEVVIIKNRLKRVERPLGASLRSGYLKNWEPKEFDEPARGLYLGKRVVTNGIRNMYHDYIDYTPKKYWTVALVVVNKNENPFYSSDIEIRETGLLEEAIKNVARKVVDRFANEAYEVAKNQRLGGYNE